MDISKLTELMKSHLATMRSEHISIEAMEADVSRALLMADHGIDLALSSELSPQVRKSLDDAQTRVEAAMNCLQSLIVWREGSKQSALEVSSKVADLVIEAKQIDRTFHNKSDPFIRQQVLEMTGGVCTYCAVPLTDGDPVEGQSAKLCVEHVVPVSKGGPDNLVNYVPSCGSCNNAKGDRHVLHFVRKVQPLREQITNVVSMVRDAP